MGTSKTRHGERQHWHWSNRVLVTLRNCQIMLIVAKSGAERILNGLRMFDSAKLLPHPYLCTCCKAFGGSSWFEKGSF